MQLKSSIKFVLLGVALMFSLPAVAFNDVDGFDHVELNASAAIDQDLNKPLIDGDAISQLIRVTFTSSPCTEHSVDTPNCKNVDQSVVGRFNDQPEKVPIN